MKRAFDLIVALGAVVVLTPLLLVLAALVRWSSPGPALYSQVRIGRHGVPFRIHKFRTMVQDADRRGTSVTVERDPRITLVGRILRKTKLDELPQLLNVIRGEMSIVGPRPEVPQIVAQYTPTMRRILEVRPGLTSVASVELANEEELLATVEDPDAFYEQVVVPAKVAYAMRHVDDPSLSFDLRVITATVLRLIALLFGHARAGDLSERLLEESRRWRRQSQAPATIEPLDREATT